MAPSMARADWLLSLYAGAASTASNTLDITPAAGSAASVSSVEYEGRAFKSPPYYGYRVGFTPKDRHVGIEGEFTHAKAIATGTPSTELTAFQLSHGLNFILGNVVYRSSPACSGRCTFVARGGAGITYPHVEATFRGRDTYQYEYGGFGAQGGAGVELHVSNQFLVVADLRLTYAHVGVDLADGGRLTGPFTSVHGDFGVGWRIGSR
jgi:lipid A oxidase